MIKRLLLKHANINIRINKQVLPVFLSAQTAFYALFTNTVKRAFFAAGPNSLPSAEVTVNNVVKFLGFCHTVRL